VGEGEREASPNILPGVYPVGNPGPYLTIVLFNMAKIDRNDGFGLNNA